MTSAPQSSRLTLYVGLACALAVTLAWLLA